MAGTRKSTRATASQAPKYADGASDTSEFDQPKANGKKTTRRKRAREDEAEDNESSPKPNKQAKPSKAAKPTPKAAVAPTTKRTPKPLPTPSNPSNRDADGNQEVFWLLKAEPLPRYENGINVAFSIDDLAACTVPEPWSGVRNPQARNNMQAMRNGDLAFFYHSNAKPSGVVGVMKVVEEAKVDETAFDKKDPYYDAKSEKEKPKWYCVGVEFVSKFKGVVDLHQIKGHAEKGGKLEGMQLVTNSRLSVSRVSKEEWNFIMELAEELDEEKGENDNTDDQDPVESKARVTEGKHTIGEDNGAGAQGTAGEGLEGEEKKPSKRKKTKR
ncbi:DUF55-domain-containing protein [Amniculicola lignicola CBS 123094]|uniref:Thymocyte nuclear protein 1 n=1 Tax=Amniculicola lignicola CBS 123094 TaxID=1392246 RepID=A0A6A5VZ42_9PLEO|nr:DUF55-domain-containing protein [Amniculicola lignicola CBS 123094]